MKKIIFLMLFLVSFNGYADIIPVPEYPDNCGLDNLCSPNDIKKAQDCLKSHIDELTVAVDTQKPIAEDFIQKHNLLIQAQSVCRKYKEYYKNSTGEDKKRLEAISIDCFNTLKDSGYIVLNFKRKVDQAKEEIKQIETIKGVLDVQTTLLRSHPNTLIEQ